MLNKNVADYTDFDGKTNKKIVQAPGGTSSISLSWGKSDYNSSQIQPIYQKPSYSDIHNPYQIYSHSEQNRSNNKYGGSHGYSGKSNKQPMKVMQQYHNPEPSADNRNTYSLGAIKNQSHKPGNYSNLQANSRENQRQKISNLSQINHKQNANQLLNNNHKQFINSNKYGGSHGYGNRPSQQQMREQNKFQSYQNKNVYDLSSIRNQSLGVNHYNINKEDEKNGQYKQQPNRNKIQQYQSVDKGKQYTNRQLVIDKPQNSNLYHQNSAYSHKAKAQPDLISKNRENIRNLSELNHNKKINNQVTGNKNKLSTYSKQSQRNHSNSYDHSLIPKSRSKDKYDQIDIAMKKHAASSKYPQNRHLHHNNPHPSKIQIKKQKLLSMNDERSPSQSKPCINFTALPPRSNMIFGDPSYNFWKQKKKPESEQFQYKHEQAFGQRVPISQYNNEKTSIRTRNPPGGKQTLQLI